MIESIPIQSFNERLKDKAAELRIPFTATLELTYSCNYRCLHCYNPTHQRQPHEIKTPKLFALLEDLARMGCLQAAFSGGEPLMHPDAFAVFEHAQKLGFEISIVTNGSLIDEAAIKRLKTLQPVLLSVSVYGITAKTYESVTQVPGSFERFMQAVELMKVSGIPLLFKMPVMTLNQHELEPAIMWFRRERLPFIHSFEIHPRADGSREPLTVRLPAEEAARMRLKYGQVDGCSRASSHGTVPSGDEAEPMFQCACGKSSLAISPYGDLNLCVTTHYPQYSLKTGSLPEGWKLLVDFVNEFKPSGAYACPKCEVADYCTRGAMDSWLEYKDFNPCVPYFKETATRIRGSV